MKQLVKQQKILRLLDKYIEKDMGEFLQFLSDENGKNFSEVVMRMILKN